MTLPRCPRCEFSYAWDGHNCSHCHLPIPTRASWESFASLVRFEYAHPKREGRKLALVGCAFVRRVAHLLPPRALATLELAESLADGVGPRLRTPPVGVMSETVSQSDPAARASLAAVHAWRLCNSLDGDGGFADAASHARAAAAWGAFPKLAWNSFPLPPWLEPYRPAFADRPSHDEWMELRHTNAPLHAAIGELFRASGLHDARERDRERDEESAQCRVYRDVFGYPFARVEFAHEWRTSTVLALARRMYESHDFSGMPILADALQDAGCDNDEILGHCRETGRGDRGEPVGGSPLQPVDHVRGCWVADLVLGKS